MKQIFSPFTQLGQLAETDRPVGTDIDRLKTILYASR